MIGGKLITESQVLLAGQEKFSVEHHSGWKKKFLGDSSLVLPEKCMPSLNL